MPLVDFIFKPGRIFEFSIRMQIACSYLRNCRLLQRNEILAQCYSFCRSYINSTMKLSVVISYALDRSNCIDGHRNDPTERGNSRSAREWRKDFDCASVTRLVTAAFSGTLRFDYSLYGIKQSMAHSLGSRFCKFVAVKTPWTIYYVAVCGAGRNVQFPVGAATWSIEHDGVGLTKRGRSDWKNG